MNTLEAMEFFLPQAGIEMYYYDQLGATTPIPRYNVDHAPASHFFRFR